MSFLGFKKRETDWWLFTLFPALFLLIALLFCLFIGKINPRNFIFIFSQQLLFFSIFLCVSDVGTLAKGQLVNISIGFPIYVLLISVVGLMAGYSLELTLIHNIELLLIFLLFSIILNYLGILLLNRNPKSSPFGEIGASELTEAKEDYERKAKRELVSKPKKNVYEDIKFGE